ncbi:MAG: neutral zinc metallopeptidase [Rugosibacter sp.]|nr:neutral zinc metallopeptidase [Rugosibacter sp.]
MRLDNERESDNIEDRRGMSTGGGGRGLVGGGIGTIVLALVAMYFGVDPSIVLNQAGNLGGTSATADSPAQVRTSPQEEQTKQMLSKILANTEDTWGKLFSESGKQYENPKLVLFSGQVQSACGSASAAMGPFYCPGDHKLYLDMSFFHDLSTRFGAPGDFAQAYVVAHEVGHHVQNLLGIADKVHSAQQRASEADKNQLQVRMELQADCYAGIWAYRADQERHILEMGDVEEALAAASGVGDDRLQQQSQGVVVPESFTHGSSEQRMTWFQRGAKSGDPRQCDTFKSGALSL